MPYNSITGWNREPAHIEHKVRPVIVAILVAVVVVIGSGMATGYITKRAEPMREYERITEYDLSKCTPVGARVTPLVRFEIESRSDGRALIKGCSRFQDNSLIPTNALIRSER